MNAQDERTVDPGEPTSQQTAQGDAGTDSVRPEKTGQAASGDGGEAASAETGTEGETTPRDASAGEDEGQATAEEHPLAKEYEALQQAHRQLKESSLRLQADFDNFRRRTREEAAKRAQEGAEGVIADLLVVIDNLERALQATEAAGHTEAEVSGAASHSPPPGEKSIRAGVAMILKQMLGVLQKHGVEPVPGVGAPFDPRWHEAVAQEEAEPDMLAGAEEASDEALVVVEEFQRGYRSQDKVLRASMVKVGMRKPTASV